MAKPENIKIAMSPIDENTVYIGVARVKDGVGTWQHKRDATSDFIAVLLDWCPPGYERQVSAPGGKKIIVTVKEVDEPDPAKAEGRDAE